MSDVDEQAVVSDDAANAPASEAIASGYRAKTTGDDDQEIRAAQALHERIQRTRKKASLTCMLSGLALGVVLATTGQAFLAEQLGGRFGTLALVVVFFAPLLGALALAEWVAERAVRARIGGWMAEVSKEHGVAVAALEDHARIAGAID